MPKTKTRAWDPAEHLITDEDMAAYLEEALQEGDSALIAAALGDIARAKGMSQIARDAGLGRESLYKALSADGNPEFATIMKVVSALGLQLHASPAQVGRLTCASLRSLTTRQRCPRPVACRLIVPSLCIRSPAPGYPTCRR